jgi:hypothetical protein
VWVVERVSTCWFCVYGYLCEVVGDARDGVECMDLWACRIALSQNKYFHLLKIDRGALKSNYKNNTTVDSLRQYVLLDTMWYLPKLTPASPSRQRRVARPHPPRFLAAAQSLAPAARRTAT